jgi:hypothetical protein
MNKMHAIQKVTIPMALIDWISGPRRLLSAVLLALPVLACAAAPLTFDTPEAAVDALQAALKTNDEAALVALVGDKYRNLVVTGDAANDAAQRAEAAAQLASYRLLDERGADRRVLLMGTQAWPMAIPLVRQAGAWHFAADQGAEELLNRRIGANEHHALDVLRAFLDAQRQYASRDRNGDGVLEYAGKLASTPGRFDGLYWAADTTKGEEASPLGPLVAASSAYLSGHTPHDAYRGYHFKILKQQGPAAAGGRYSYLINGRLVAGFAMVAYPAVHGDSGVMSFIVNHNGKIFEKNLGPDSARVGAAMAAFDPGAGWKEVAP